MSLLRLAARARRWRAGDIEDPLNDPEWVDDRRRVLAETGERLLAMWKNNHAFTVSMGSSSEDVWRLFKSGKYSDGEIVEKLRACVLEPP